MFIHPPPRFVIRGSDFFRRPSFVIRHSLVALLAAAAAFASDLSIHPGELRVLVGPEARQQLVVGTEVDLTREATYTVEPPGVVEVSPAGTVIPRRSGLATITASHDGQSVRTQVEVRQPGRHPPVSFPNDIVPIFTKGGCNGGGCHGKAEGQNGFKLSLLGYEPVTDYGHPRQGSPRPPPVPGRARTQPDHQERHRRVPARRRRALRARLPLDPDAGRLDPPGHALRRGHRPRGHRHHRPHPGRRLLQPGTRQQLAVTAHYSDGSQRDITHIAQYESNQKEMAEIDANGLLTVADLTGSASVMVRFQEFVGVFQAIIPLGAEIGELPPARNFIDQHIHAKLRQLGLPPSPDCDDATFLRRVTIDIAGRLPTMAETKAFHEDTAMDKRTTLIDRLLDSEDYADHFANKWSAILRNKRNKGSYAHGTFAFHRWIRHSIADNKPYDQFAREILTATGDIAGNPPVAWYRQVKTQKAQLQDAAQIFLGVRLQCAECHHHPYEKWSEDDYYGFAAFFSQVGRKPGERPDEEFIVHRRGAASARNPRSGGSLKPTPLDEEPLALSPDDDPRVALADWMGRPDNEFFARMLVNRYWKHFFGRGLVEPEDDVRVTNPATHPKLLQALSRHFVEGGYDMKDLVRTICNSRTYQLSALPNEHNAKDQQNYSRYYPKRLSAEVLLDAIDAVTDKPTTFGGLPAGTRAVQLPDDSFNAQHYFLTVFGRPEMDSACECERSSDANLAQCLHLLNSKTIQGKLSAKDGTANRLAGEKDRELEQKVRELYHRCFSREPLSDEVEIARNYLEGREGEKLTEGYQDILWALINTKEFLFNH